MQIEKTVFISYRRKKGNHTALLIRKELEVRRYDCFRDYDSINSGSFSQIILDEIANRAHFLILLNESTLLRCNEPNDWVRREIETALDKRRNIVPIVFEDFDWGIAKEYLTGKLSFLSDYNQLAVPDGYLEQAMDKLADRHLNISLDKVKHPLSLPTEVNAPQPIEKLPLALPSKQQNTHDKDEYLDRSISRRVKADYIGAIADANEAIKLDRNFVDAYINRANALREQGNANQAIIDYDYAIALESTNATAYYGRAKAYLAKADLDQVIADTTKAIELKPNYAKAYKTRSLARQEKGDHKGAAKDLVTAKKLAPTTE